MKLPLLIAASFAGRATAQVLLLVAATYGLYVVGKNRTLVSQLPDSPGRQKAKWLQKIFLTLALLLIVQAVWNLWQLFRPK